MSGISGLINFDGAAVLATELHSMLAMLARRGPDGSEACIADSVGLGHALLATTAALRTEKQPFRHAATGCVITADVRLDNRENLLAALNLPRQRTPVGDAELILRAYLCWGDQAPARLLGDFAFAIYDPREARLFCARDHAGLRPFYYHSSTSLRFAFASDARAILVLPQVAYERDQGRIADFLVQELEWLDYTSTFYSGIRRLPPGHQLTVDASGVDIVEYWRAQPRGNALPDDYAAGFLEVFTSAVAARLEGGNTGAMLSGGMDSGSVVAVARGILAARGAPPLSTFSALRENADDCRESKAIRATLDVPDIEPDLILPAHLDDWHEMLSGDLEEPYDGEFMLLKAIYRRARDRGLNVVLDGGAGDVIFNEGTYLTRLLRQGKLRLAVAEIAASSRFWPGDTFWGSLYRHSRAAWTPLAIKHLLRGTRYRRRIQGYVADSLISGEFARAVDIETRFERMREIFPQTLAPDLETERCISIRPHVTAGRERYGRLAAAMGIEASDPFLDKRVIDYCVGLPGNALLANGWPKILLRKVMAGKIPDAVRWSRGKPHLGWRFNDAVSRNALRRGELSLTQLQSDLAPLVNTAALHTAWKSFIAGNDVPQIHTAFILSNWLRATAARPAP